MSAFGGVVGIQEGMEAGFVTGGFANAEQHPSRAIAACLGATAVGVAVGNYFGERALSVADRFIGDGGIGFLPAIAIGAIVAWHNTREHSPAQTTRKFFRGVPYVLGAAFAAFEGGESGILTSSVNTGLLTAEAVTLTAAAATVATFGSFKYFAEKLSPGQALRAARAFAILPAAYLAARATPELIDNPKPLGVGVAIAGTAAVVKAIQSFFKKSEHNGSKSLDYTQPNS